jgi:hypothetical protein
MADAPGERASEVYHHNVGSQRPVLLLVLEIRLALAIRLQAVAVSRQLGRCCANPTKKDKLVGRLEHPLVKPKADEKIARSATD